MMTVEEALQLIDNLAAQFNGTRTDHIKLQQAIQTIQIAISSQQKAQIQAKPKSIPKK